MKNKSQCKQLLLLLLVFTFSAAIAFGQNCGDANVDGSTDIIDALLVAQCYVGLTSCPSADIGDVNCDGQIDIVDALLIAQLYVGLLDELACCGTPEPTPGSDTYELQAEDEEWSSGGVESDHSGYTGTGYVNTDNASGEWIEWSVEVDNDCNATCVFSYACASDARPMDLSINGTDVASLGFPASGAWDSWATETADVILDAGSNAIRLTATGSGGAPNMDKMDITIKGGAVVTPTPTPAPTPTPTPTPTPEPTEPGATPTPNVEGLVAFPGAEGYGKVATGGRGGAVYEVTTLSSSGSGSLGAAIGASGRRTVVFRVGGTINGNFTISNGDITIAGQTAPGDGIAIHGHLTVNANNVIIRYIRVRGTGSGDTITNNHNSPKHTQIYDHISTNWSSDEVMSIYFNENITIQYCMITEACSGSHQFAGIWGGDHNSYHHNLFAHCTDRTPRIASGSGYNDVRNNVIYNWANLGMYGGEVHEVGDSSHTGCWVNAVGNYFKPGPGTPEDYATRMVVPTTRQGASDYGDWYVAENYLYGYPDITADNWLGVVPHYWDTIDKDLDAIPGIREDSPVEHMPIRYQTALEAYETVLAHSGCAKPNRDSLDARIIEEVRTGTAVNGDGFISSPGSLPSLASGTAPTDSDHDGMSDDWENAHGLDPNNASDRNNTDSIGYTMLENYINSLDDF